MPWPRPSGLPSTPSCASNQWHALHLLRLRPNYLNRGLFSVWLLAVCAHSLVSGCLHRNAPSGPVFVHVTLRGATAAAAPPAAAGIAYTHGITVCNGAQYSTRALCIPPRSGAAIASRGEM